jgi:hypothetical protein
MATKAERFKAAAMRGPPRAPAPQRVVRIVEVLVEEEERPRPRPSRISTRRGFNREKPETNLERRQQRRTHSPAARAARVAARNSTSRGSPRGGLK